MTSGISERRNGTIRYEVHEDDDGARIIGTVISPEGEQVPFSGLLGLLSAIDTAVLSARSTTHTP